MFEIERLLPLIPAAPLLAAVLVGLLGPRVLRGAAHWPVVLALVFSTAASIALAVRVAQQGRRSPEGRFEQIVVLWTWADVQAAQLGGRTAAQPAGLLPEPSALSSSLPESAISSSPAPADGKQAPSSGGVASSAPRLRIAVSLRADALTALMLVTVTVVSLLVAIYSIGYMHGDRGYWRFFAYLALFVFSMTMLVSVSNFVLLYVFWEAVGLCSYLLIGFWYEKPAAAAAGKKAFLVNRVGDFGFALGLFLLWTAYGTLDFHDTSLGGEVAPGILGETALGTPGFYHGGALGLAICLLLLAGACGKSAQFPLHVWLPDAMEGPTPVSALIHAATMVTAGVYLVARCFPLYSAVEYAGPTVAAIGTFTALLAALIATAQTDLKRILAYSTVSQLGFMFLALGTAVWAGAAAGMFHLFTHAFFKALLFLGAGSVMHAMGGVIDIRRFSGLRRIMPITHLTFLIGCLALAGVPPFSGFFSKDAVLLAVDAQGHGPMGAFYQALFYTALAAAALTAFYTFRAFFLTFYGPTKTPEEAGGHAHESPAVMTVPLVLLALGAAGVGGYCEWTHRLNDYLARTPQWTIAPGAPHREPPPAMGAAPAATSVASAAALPSAAAPASAAPVVPADPKPHEPAHDKAAHLRVALLSTAAALLGLATAAVLYLFRRREDSAAEAPARGLVRLCAEKFYIDELYETAIVAPLRIKAAVLAWFDNVVIDGAVDGVGRAARALGGFLRPLHNGLLPFYALAMVVGLLMLLGAMLI